MDTKKLRQKILDLAIRGKLVPQDPNDEPASVLLERIRAEKEQLIKEGKIKRSKKSAATDKSHYENVPFEIPESWCWTTLGELCSIKGGKRLPKGKSFADTITPHIYIRVTDMKDHTVLLSSLKYIDEDVFAEIKNYTISSNDLYLTIAGTIGDVGLVPAELDGANLTENAAKLTDIKCSKQYLMYVLMSSIAQDHFCSRFHQVAQPKLSLETASSTLIPLPPYGEQLRIAEELDRWLGVVVSVEDDLSELTNYVRKTKSKILDLAISGKLVSQDPNNEPAIELLKRINPAFKPCDNSHYENVPENWCLAKVKDVFVINPRNKAEDNTIAGFIPMTLIDDGYSNTFSYEKRKWGSIKTGFTHFADGDVAVAKISPCLENRKSIVLRDLPNAIGAGTTELHVFRSSVVVPEYALYFFKSEYFISKCVGTFNGVVGQQRVGKNIIEEIQIPIPPINEQTKIVSTIETIFTQLNTITAEL